MRLSRSIEEGTDPFLARLARQYHHYSSDQPPAAEEIDQLARRLHLWLDTDENFAVLAAVAAFPKLDPKLTLLLGRLVLGRQLDDGLASRLARLPWMRDGRMPDWLRIAVINRLPDATRDIVCAKILAMLDIARRPQTGEAAWRALEDRIALFDVALPKDSAGSIDPNIVGEHIFLSFLHGEKLDPIKGALEPRAPAAIKDALSRDFDRRTAAIVVGFSLLAVTLFMTQDLLLILMAKGWDWAWTTFVAPSRHVIGADKDIGHPISDFALSLLIVAAALCATLAPFIYKYYLGVLAQGAAPEGSLERQDYDKLRASLAGGNLAARLYAKWLTAFLDWIERFFGDAGMADRTLFPRAFGLKTPAPLWTAPAFDRCLLLALIYPIATIFAIWAISGHVGPAEAALGLNPDVPGWSRGLVAAANGFSSFAFWRGVRERRWKSHVWINAGVAFAVAGAFAFAGAGAGAFDFAGADAVAGAVAGALVVAVAFAFGGDFAGAVAGAGAGALAVAFAFAFAGAFAGVGTVAFAFAFAFAFAVAFAFAGAFAGAGAVTFAIAFAGAGASVLAGAVASVVAGAVALVAGAVAFVFAVAVAGAFGGAFAGAVAVAFAGAGAVAGAEIDQARDHGREQERIDPPIFRRRRIFGDAVEKGVQRQDTLAAAMKGKFFEGLHAEHHGQCEGHNDGTGESRIDKGQKEGPPASEFQPAPQQRPRQAKRSPVERRVEQCEQPQEEHRVDETPGLQIR